jgi:hypothetical protein
LVNTSTGVHNQVPISFGLNSFTVTIPIQDIVPPPPLTQNLGVYNVEVSAGASTFGSSDIIGNGTYFTTDACPDTDGDGWADDADNCPTVYNPSQADSNQDGVGDACEPQPPPPPPLDSDGDGIPNISDNCPFQPNPDQTDGDGDMVGDACDNCPDDFNTYQSDGDGNDGGDVCDTDMPPSLELKVVRLKSETVRIGNDGTILVRGVLDTAEYGGVDGLRHALRQPFFVNITGAGLAPPGQILAFPPCRSVIGCQGTDNEVASFTRKGATDLFNLRVQAWNRTFPPPLTSAAVRVILSLGGLDRSDAIGTCRAGRRGGRVFCRRR